MKSESEKESENESENESEDGSEDNDDLCEIKETFTNFNDDIVFDGTKTNL